MCPGAAGAPLGSMRLVTWTLPWADPMMPVWFRHRTPDADNTQANNVWRTSQTSGTWPGTTWQGGWRSGGLLRGCGILLGGLTIQVPVGSISAFPTAAPREQRPSGSNVSLLPRPLCSAVVATGMMRLPLAHGCRVRVSL